MSKPEIGSKIRVLDKAWGNLGAEYTVVEDKWGWEGYFGEPEFTTQDNYDRELDDAHYFEIEAEGTTWERVSADKKEEA